MYQLLFFKSCYELITSRNNGITCAAAINCFKCKFCEMCHAALLAALFTAKAYVHFDAWTTEKTLKYMN
jgi:hypothetical protein